MPSRTSGQPRWPVSICAPVMSRRYLVFAPVSVLVTSVLWSACGGSTAPLQSPQPQPSTSQSALQVFALDASVDDAQSDVLAQLLDAATEAEVPVDASTDAAQDGPCPSDMIHVEHDFCPRVERKCVKKELNKPNRIVLCHKFQEGSTKCLEPRQHLDYCIDKYEYPNRAGAHPPWMVSWYDAEATCRSLGKRICWDWEWVAACEGPQEKPFPYGWERDNTKCNIDNIWMEPRLKEMYSKDKAVAARELARVDQSVPSGAMPGCVSDLGVHDLTGNMDEWVSRVVKRDDKEKSMWAGLKGGAWGHVRNACRPMTTSHPPDFTYYFITFRCCADPKGKPAFVPPGISRPPAQQPADRAPIPTPVNPPGPSKQKVRPENDGK